MSYAGVVSLWEQTRRTVQDDIAAAAMDLFVEHGFDAVTMDEIATRAGISRRSLFRYFGTKEDLVLRSVAGTGESIAAALRARPRTEGPWAAVLAVADELESAPEWDPARERAIGRMCVETPALRARRAEKHQGWVDLFTPELAARPESAPVGESAAGAIAAAALACLDVATDRWVAEGGVLAAHFAQAVAAVRS
ncbi:transcriptional regulator, TetR family [Pseudonocardia oroxyli]|uniref:Transcriptional regulator, TetR family n=1 Tax=Pseudonocardia oroxyli TaxID=366584 RepID=A0A1G7UXR2_PSEOR|nr:transcriptional regulator, TetR family [Pseudonocardia oroxyli]